MEAAVSRDCATAHKPGQQSKTLAQKINKRQVWWHMPVISAIWEARAETLEPGRQRLKRAEIAPLHSSLGNKSKTPLKKKTIETLFIYLVYTHPYNPLLYP